MEFSKNKQEKGSRKNFSRKSIGNRSYFPAVFPSFISYYYLPFLCHFPIILKKTTKSIFLNPDKKYISKGKETAA